MNPAELIERALVNSSRKNNVIADLFGGSGSTLIGCERMGRSARMMELDPRYSDVIIRRFVEYTGKQALLDGTNLSFDQVAQERKQNAA